MQTKRFFSKREDLKTGSKFKMEEKDAIHALRSLRLNKGDHIVVSNGREEFDGLINNVNGNDVYVKVGQQLEASVESVQDSKHIALYQSLIKLPAFELVLQKSTELGASGIIPMTTEFSQIRLPIGGNKVTRWEYIIESACKQSERVSIPVLGEPLDFDDALEQRGSYDINLLLTLERQSEVVHHIADLGEKLKLANSIAIWTGPEGGFSPTEHKKAITAGLLPVTLGDYILKSETASIVALANLNLLVHS